MSGSSSRSICWAVACMVRGRSSLPTLQREYFAAVFLVPRRTTRSHILGTGGSSRHYTISVKAVTCKDIGGRGGDRTHDRWCVKPELYH
jgi:hypothetical protein